MTDDVTLWSKLKPTW